MKRINFDWFSCRSCKRYRLKWKHPKTGSFVRCKCGFDLVDAEAIDRQKRR